MSFTIQVREELVKNISGSRLARRAEAAAILALIGKISRTNRDQYHLILALDNVHAVTKFFTLLQKTFNIFFESAHLDFAHSELSEIDLSEYLTRSEIKNVLESLGYLTREGDFLDFDRVPPSLLADDKSRRAFLRGTFLCIGSIADPDREYSIEFDCQTESYQQQICYIARQIHLQVKKAERRNYHVAYARDSAVILSLLNYMGAPLSQMQMENARIVKQMRSSINRQVNCETSNIRRSAEAALRQIEAIRRLRRSREWDQLPDTLKSIAVLRLEHPESSLVELGQLLDPPVGKSGVNHRLRKLSVLADELDKNTSAGEEV